MSRRAGKPLSWAMKNALGLLKQPQRYLCQDSKSGSWSVSAPQNRPTYVDWKVAELLVEERAVEPTAHVDRRWFKISERGRQAEKDSTWPL